MGISAEQAAPTGMDWDTGSQPVPQERTLTVAHLYLLRKNNFLNGEKEQRERTFLHSMLLESKPGRCSVPAGIPLVLSINHGGFGSFPAPAVMVWDKGELGGLQG